MAAELKRMADLVEPEPETAEPTTDMTPKKWKKFLQHIANGLPRHKAVKEINVTAKTLELYLRLEPDALGQYQEARMVKDRKQLPMELIDQMLGKIATGARVKDVCTEHGVLLQSFINVMIHDPT